MEFLLGDLSRRRNFDFFPETVRNKNAFADEVRFTSLIRVIMSNLRGLIVLVF